MTEIEPKNLEEMKRFLFHELSEKERESIEERFFTDQDFFYDLMELENSLVDGYVRKELKADDLKRFEMSLEKSPERLEKIKDALALKALIEKENQTVQPTVIETQPSFWEKLLAFFTLQMSSTQYVTAALLFLLLGGIGFLIYDRTRLNQELANYRENQKTLEDLQKQERNLQNQLNEIQEREQNLQNQINEKQGESEILNQQLQREKAERERIENELTRLKNLPQNLPPTPIQPPKPTIATVVLSPFFGSRDGGGNEVKTVKLDSNTKSVNLTLQIPKESTAELFLIRFKGQIIVSKQKPQKTKSGVRFVTVTIPANQFSTNEENTVTVLGNDGVRYDYLLKIQI